MTRAAVALVLSLLAGCSSAPSDETPSGTVRLFLAAMELRFTHPVTEELLHFTWDTPKKFRAYLNREDKRWRRAQASGALETS